MSNSGEKSGELSPLKQALLAVRKMRERVAELERASRAPIAIVGAGCRLPGGVVDLDGYWELLRNGVDAVRPVPSDRWDAERWYGGPDPTRGRIRTTHGGFLDDIARFDAEFFGISPREALEMDPAQRMLLEVAVDALEHAGLPLAGLEGTPTGVYVGLGLSDYSRRHFGGADPKALTAYSGTGSFLSVAAGRISYALGLQGPALTVDTACSSSLVSIHLAVQALRRGEVDVALAGGANTLISPMPSVYFSQLQALAPDGRCKTFDAAADGYGRGEGCGVLVLKRLSEAQRDGDRVLAVIRGTAVNQDGRSNGLTAPSGRAQEQVLKQALRDGGVAPSEVAYVEAHGTGTPLGDPVELGALGRVFAGVERPVAVGSAKTNFGHLETAAGVAGVLKAVLVLTHRTVPPHLHLTELNPRIRLGDALVIPTEATAIVGSVAGVSSFGLSGTNAHVVLEAAPEPDPVAVASPVALVGLSARTEPGLKALAEQTASMLTDVSAADVGAAFWNQRTPGPWRLAAVGSTEVVQMQLQAVAAGGGSLHAPRRGPGPVFAYTGQGAQAFGMASELYATEPVFRAALDEVFGLLDPHLERPLREVWFETDDGAIDDTGYTQPALFALQVALTKLWAHWGVEPEAVVGHSIGEYAAAWAVGRVGLEDAARLVCRRGRRMSELPRGGAMAAILAPEGRVAAWVASTDAAIAAVNGPTETVVSGTSDAVQAVIDASEAAGVRTVRLTVSHPFHSPWIEPAAEAFERDLEGVRWSEGFARFEPTGGEDPDLPRYWVEQIRNPVRFAAALERLAADGHDLFLEIGPRPVLCGMGARTLPDARWIGSLDPEQSDAAAIRRAAGALFEAGQSIAGARIAGRGPFVELPASPWGGERYWLDRPEGTASDPLEGLAWEVQWAPSQAGSPVEPGEWLLVGEAPAIVAELAERGHEVSVVPADSEPRPHDRVILVVDGGDALSETVRAHGWLTRAHGRTWVVVRGESEAAEAVRGLARVAALERPGSVTRIDADGWLGVTRALVERPASWLRVSQGRIEEPRLRRSRRAGGPVPEIGGTWLITGGLGALGGHAADWLARRGADRIVLVGRRGPETPGAAERVAALTALGVAVEVASVDLAVPDEVTELVDRCGPVAGAIHAAGVLDDARLTELTPEHFERAMAAKLVGGRSLARALPKDARLVLFSSATATLGTVGQAAYAAANAALAGLARSRPGAVAIEWGPWAGAGMADVPPAIASAWARSGIRTLDPADAAEAMGAILGGERRAVLVAPFDWPLLASQRPGDPLLAELGASVPASAPVRSVVALVQELSSRSPVDRWERLAEHVGGRVASVLGRTDPPDLDQGFFEAGMDSLMAVELRNRLQADLGATLPATLAFDHPSIRALVDWVLGVVLDLAGHEPTVGPSAAIATEEPVAIVGAACRFPGAPDLDAFWELLISGREAVGPVPDGRFDLDRFFDPSPATPGHLYAREAGYVDGIEDFDAELFGIHPREARALDPQQRILLETTWAALEDAAIAPGSIRRGEVGVFVGIAASEYGRRFDPLDASAEPDPYAGTGNESSFAAGRVAHALGVNGPTLSVNTACSSSLVALHLAARALRQGECALALVGGVNAIPGPEVTVQLSQIRALSPTSRCHTFDAAADGYVRGEGCGVVVLKRLSEALADGDPVRAVLGGSAVNHDGPSAGLTVPSGPAQQAVIRAAQQQAGMQPSEVGFVECHGTGTPLGDPIEVGALRAVFGERQALLRLGAVKANIGHLEAGAGIAGLLKAVLALEHGTIPPHPSLRELNPELPLHGFASVPTEALPWTERRVAGVSSFGLSGTNAHAVLREAPAVRLTAHGSRPDLVVVAGHSPDAARARAAGLAGWLARAEVDEADVVHTLHASRAEQAHRLVGLRGEGESLVQVLSRMHGERPIRSTRRRVAWLFTGQGSQYVGMGRGLYDAFEAYRQTFDAVAAAVDPLLDAPLVEVVFGDEGRLGDTRWTQPALYALQCAQARLWLDWGAVPEAVVGHSIGQLAAAWVAGVVDLETGARMAALRGRSMGTLPRDGLMVAARCDEDRVLPLLGDAVSLAAVNAPGRVVISGRTEAVEAVARTLGEQGVETTALRTSHAFHSPLMDPAVEVFAAQIGDLELHPATLRIVDTVEGRDADLTDPAAWARHIRQPVHFLNATRALEASGIDSFVELGPHPVLLGMVAATLEDRLRIPSARRSADDRTTLLQAVGTAAAHGVEVALERVQPGRRIHLPPLPMQRERHWVDFDPGVRVGPGPVPLYGIDWVPAAGTRALGHVRIVGEAHGLDEVLELGDGAVLDLRSLGSDDALGRLQEAVALCAETTERVVLVTRGATAADPAPGQRALWGFAATAVLERAAGRFQIVDLPSGELDREGLLAALRSDQALVSVRDGVVHRPSVVPVEPGDAVSPAGTWWVTGGLGAVGLHLAEGLAARGVGRLILTGRSEPGERARAVVERLRESVPVDVVLGDVSTAAGVSALLAEIGPVDGVVHAAGALSDGLIRGLGPDDVAAVWTAKADGARWLHEALPDAELVFVSSVAGTLGAVGQAAYGAANAYLDGLAEHRRANGQLASSIAWGPWAGAGLADQARNWEASGIRPLVPSRALTAFDGGRTLGRVAAVDLDWDRWLASLPHVPGWLGSEVAKAPATEWLTRLTGAPARARHALLVDLVVQHTAAVLGREPSAIDPGQGFFESGFDSLLAVELVERLQRDLGHRLPRTLVFEQSSPDAVATWLLGDLELDEPAADEVWDLHRGDRSDPIAIIGMALRFPGADTVEEFWELLRDGREAVGPVPADRWDAEALYDPDRGVPGRSYARDGAFLDRVDTFDAAFFGISPREADSMDPQQRLLLEVGWEALERAGTVDGLRESRTGVFVGIAESDYLNRFRRPGDPFYGETHAGSGNEGSFPAGRVSYLLGLQGPAITLNTACSSSLVATHLACNSLRLGECDLALAAGVSLMLSPDNHTYLSQLGALSPTGHCHTFDASADGYVRGEGCGVLVLKRLSEARRDGDRVLAVLRGSAVNHDGPSSGLTVPNGTAQQRVIRQALAAAGVEPADVDYLEAHGTGTPLGDPVEVRAADAVFGEAHAGQPMWLGSVKTNVGHLEQAAAMAGIAKVVLALQHEQLPPHRNLEQLNPEIELGDRWVIPRALTDWGRSERARIAGISSFGISGTNGHLVIQEPPLAPEPHPDGREPVFLGLTGGSAEAVVRAGAELAEWWRAHPDVPAHAVAATRLLERGGGRFRAAVTGADRDRLLAALETPRPSEISSPRIAFLFTGQGAQTPGMGAALYETEPVFREVVDRCSAVVDPILGRPLKDVLVGQDDAIHDTRFTQPAMFAYEVAVTELWRSWGIEPAAVIGHSVGQLAAATAAGVWSIEAGAEMVAHRARLMGDLPREGRMIAALGSEEDVQAVLGEHPQVSLAGANGPAETVLSGPTDAVDALEAALVQAGFQVKALKTSHAFHSSLMEPIVEDFDDVVSRFELADPTVPFVGNATGAFVGQEVRTAGFWARAIREPVRFQAGVQTLLDAGYRHVLEVGNHPVLAGLVAQVGEGVHTYASAHRKRPAPDTLVEAAGGLWQAGAPLDGEAFLRRGPAHLALPTTPFDPVRHWLQEPEPAPSGLHDTYALDWEPVDRDAELSGELGVLGAPEVVEALVSSGLTAKALSDLSELDGLSGVVDARFRDQDDPIEAAGPALELLQACAERAIRPWFLASPAVEGLLSGLVRVAAEEHEGLNPTVVRELADLRAPVDHRTVRAGRVPKLVPAPVAGSMALSPGAILITGGFGDLGLATARWLLDRGAQELWLVSRSGPRPEVAPALRELVEGGATVVAEACDVSDRDQVQALLARMREGPGIAGVVHAAGVLDDALLTEQTPERFARVLAAKVGAARILADATRDDELGLFVLYSSAAAILGLPGQATYAAANAALDALAIELREGGRPALSVQWGPWAASGMVARLSDSVLEHQRRLGIGHLDPERALETLDAALASDLPVVAVLSVDWDRNLRQYAGRSVPGLLGEFVSDASIGERDSEALPALVALVRPLPADQWPDRIEAFVAERVNRIQRAPEDRELDRERPLWDMGMDSMMTVELRNALMADGVRLQVARMIGGPSIREVALMVVAELEAHPAIAGVAPTADTSVDDEEEPPLDPVWSHLGAAFGGSIATAILLGILWQLFG